MHGTAVKLAPSILNADFAHLGDQVLEAEQAGADRIHVDVMDGHHVPNLSMGAAGRPWTTGRTKPNPPRGINMIDRRTFTTTLMAGVATSLLGRSSGAQAEPAVGARNVVLVHGAYADGSCWSEVIERLQLVGLKATAVQNPLTSLADDVAATLRILALQDGPTVLVGHSWAGTVISEAGVDPKVSALVYVAARAPDAGEDYAALAARFPTPPASAGLVKSGGFAQLSEEAFLRDFAGGVDPAKASVLYAVQGRIADTLFASRTTAAAWKLRPSWYAISKQDRTTSPELERFLANRMHAKTIEVDASHLSLVTHPQEITDLILSAAGVASDRLETLQSRSQLCSSE